jgi:phosphotransferase system enzyme I (PtsI)
MSSDTDGAQKEMKFKGISINAGRVVAPACLFASGLQKLIPEYILKNAAAVKRELARFKAACDQCTGELTRMAAEVETTIGKAEAEIFLTQMHIMNDPKVVDVVNKLIGAERKNAEWAIAKVLGEFEDRFASLDDQYLRERSSDISEIRRRLLGLLTNNIEGFVCHGQPHCRRGANRVIAAEELSASMVVNMKMENVLGFVTEHGGISSHAAILARSLGIPAVTGVEGIMQHVACGDTILINGDTGDIILHPEKATIDGLIEALPLEKEPAEVALTPRGMEVFANTSSLDDVKQAQRVSADGIGLFRTEILFVGAERLLSEDEQFTLYDKVMEIMGGKPVTFRMLDIGGDKPLPFLRLKKEANPFLGWRGARFLLGNPAIFSTQIRALGRLTLAGKIRILFPMVIDRTQMQTLLDRSREALSGIEHNSANIEFGAMFEVPSAFIQARDILKLIDFSSIGSNDLIQYLFAIDRDNDLVSHEYDVEHPALWTMLSELSRAAHELDKPLSICGEMAGHEGMTKKLLGAGITTLSVAPRLIPRVRGEMLNYAKSRA